MSKTKAQNQSAEPKRRRDVTLYNLDPLGTCAQIFLIRQAVGVRRGVAGAGVHEDRAIFTDIIRRTPLRLATIGVVLFPSGGLKLKYLIFFITYELGVP